MAANNYIYLQYSFLNIYIYILYHLTEVYVFWRQKPTGSYTCWLKAAPQLKMCDSIRVLNGLFPSAGPWESGQP